MANPMFEKLVAKKKAEGKGMSPSHQKAKGDVLGDLMDHLDGAGMEKVKGMKKVSVASTSKEGLTKGLDKAKELVDKVPGEDEEESALEASDEGSDAEESAESPEMEASEGSEGEAAEMSSEEKDAKIAELEAELAKHKSMSMGRI